MRILPAEPARPVMPGVSSDADSAKEKSAGKAGRVYAKRPVGMDPNARTQAHDGNRSSLPELVNPP